MKESTWGSSSATRPLQRVLSVVFVLVAATWAAGFAYQSGAWDTTCYEDNVCDSLTFTVVAELLSEGKTPYVEQVRRDYISKTRLSGAAPRFDLRFLYPPNALPIFAIRSAFSPATAHIGMAFITTLTCLSLVVRLTCRRLSDNLGAALLSVAIALSGIVALNAALGQTGLLAAGLVLGVVLSWVRAPLVAGVVLGVLAFKPQYAAPLLLVALIRRDWRIVTGAAATFAALTVTSGIAFGFNQWRWFLDAVAGSDGREPGMVNWTGLVWRLAPVDPNAIQSAAPSGFMMFVLALVGTAAVLWAIRARMDLETQLSVAVTMAVFASPHTHPYDLLVLVPALVEVSRRSWGLGVGPIFFAVTWLALPFPNRWVIVLGIVALGVCCLMSIGREGHATRIIRPPRLPWRVAHLGS